MKLEDVDGTKPGVAVLISADLSKGYDARILHETFVEGEFSCTDPHDSAQRFRVATGDDFPGHTHTIMVNERARYLMATRRMREMLGEAYTQTPAEYFAEHRTKSAV